MRFKKRIAFLASICVWISFSTETFAAAGYCQGGTPTPISWTDPALTPGTVPIKALHITELRAAINSKRSTCGMANTVWSENISSGNTVIKRAHIQELRTSTNDLVSQAAVVNAVTPVLPNYTDASIVVGQTIIKASHIQDIRTAVNGVSCGGLGPQSSTSMIADRFYQAPSSFSAPVWNNYKFWLIAQFNAMGTDISGMDFTPMANFFNGQIAGCNNTGYNGNFGVSQNFNVSGITVVLNVKWEGNEWLDVPVAARNYLAGAGRACKVTIAPSLVGSLNGFTCP